MAADTRTAGKGAMSEFKFLCPECGQKILGDAAYSGTQIACPGCQKTITVPPATAAPAANPAPANVAARSAPPPPPPILPPPARPAAPAPAAAGRGQSTQDRLSKLAVASLLCSVFVPLGAIPGIICGHMAKARMRRNIFLVGAKMAGAGLLISYCVLLALLVLAGVSGLERWHFRPAMILRDSPSAMAALQPRVVDEVIIGDNEDDHNVQGRSDSVGVNQGKSYRIANHGGSFSYQMNVLPKEAMTLNCRYWGDETRGHLFEIAVDNQIIATDELTARAPGHFIDVEYKIPAGLTRGKTQVRVEFQAHPGMLAGGIYGCQMLKP
jgi:hypothetical protein